MYRKIYFNVVIFFAQICFIQVWLQKAIQHPDMKISQYYECLWGMSMNAYEQMLADNADISYLDADSDAT